MGNTQIIHMEETEIIQQAIERMTLCTTFKNIQKTFGRKEIVGS